MRRWLAPERLLGGLGGLPADVYAFGTVRCLRFAALADSISLVSVPAHAVSCSSA